MFEVILPLREAADFAKIHPSEILSRCQQQQLYPLIELRYPVLCANGRVEMGTFDPGYPAMFTILEHPAIKWRNDQADPTANINGIMVETHGQRFKVCETTIIRESDLHFRKWEVTEPEWFTIQEVVDSGILEDDAPLSVADVAKLTVIRFNPRTRTTEPVLWSSFLREKPMLAQRLEYTGKRLHDSDLPGGGMEMVSIEEMISGYLDIREWECSKCPWCDESKGSVLRVSKGDKVYTVKSSVSVRKTELCFSEDAIVEYLTEMGHDNDVNNRLELLKQTRAVEPESMAESDSDMFERLKQTDLTEKEKLKEMIKAYPQITAHRIGMLFNPPSETEKDDKGIVERIRKRGRDLLKKHNLHI